MRVNNCLLYTDNPYVLYLILDLLFPSDYVDFHPNIKFIWIPSHSNRRGNEFVDSICREVNSTLPNRIYMGAPIIDRSKAFVKIKYQQKKGKHSTNNCKIHISLFLSSVFNFITFPIILFQTMTFGK